jgi:hypothetical protein
MFNTSIRASPETLMVFFEFGQQVSAPASADATRVFRR